MHELDEALFDLSWYVMAKGTWLCSKAVAKVMIEQGSGGKIVNISSILGKVQSALAIGAGGGSTTFRFVHKLPSHEKAP